MSINPPKDNDINSCVPVVDIPLLKAMHSHIDITLKLLLCIKCVVY